MELVHKAGCDLRHTPRQQCNVPGREHRQQLYVWELELPVTSGTSAPARPSLSLTISRAKARRAILLELVPIFAFVVGASLWMPGLFGHYIGDYQSLVL